MSFKTFAIALSVLMTFSAVGAKTPTQLKEDLAQVFGANKAAYIVFQSQIEGSSNKLLKLNSLDGTVKDFLTNQPANSFMTHPTFTLDGTRVVFWNTQSPSVYIANWSDGVCKKVISGYEGYSSYKNSSGADIILCKKVRGQTLHLVDADNGTISTAYSGSLNPEYYSISGDGKCIAAIWQGFGTIGINTIGNSAVSYLGCPRPTGKICEGGCWCTISRDDKHIVMWTIEPHAGCVIGNENKTLYRDVPCFPWIPTPGTSGDVDKDNPNQYNGLRWSNDLDFASCYQEGSVVASLPLTRGPYIVNLANLKYTYLVDNAANDRPGITGMHVYPISTQNRNALSVKSISQSLGKNSVSRYDITGRLQSQQKVSSGLVIKQSNNTVNVLSVEMQ